MTASDVPTELLAVQLYDPDLSLCMFAILKIGPLESTMLGLCVLNHFHTIPLLGFASVSIHSSVAVFPSITMYGLMVLVTSGLSIKQL